MRPAPSSQLTQQLLPDLVTQAAVEAAEGPLDRTRAICLAGKGRRP